MNIAVLVSGSGTLLEAMIDAELPIRLVVADRPCRGLEVAANASIEGLLLERSEWGSDFDRDAYSELLETELARRRVDLVAMAGFGTILGESVFESLNGRIINTHPALLPSFPGWHAVRDAIDFGVKVTGCTIHIATPVVDAGPILAQAAVDILPDDDEASLHERIKEVERRLYVDTLRSIFDSRQILGTPI